MTTTSSATSPPATTSLAAARQRCGEILDEIDRVMVRRRPTATLVLQGVLASGHVLIEDVPGTGKTVLARAFAAALGLQFTRVQFTPDLLPSDLTGVEIYDPDACAFGFRNGPVFTNLLLADEINRTPPKTQAALLEAMAERHVSVGGRSVPLPDPFVVLATDNPVEYEGTYPLPEAQLDRFMLRVRLGYLTVDEEVELVRRRTDSGRPEPPATGKIVSVEEVRALRAAVERVEVADDVARYAAEVVAGTRSHPQVHLGASPRATLDLVRLARTAALIDGRDFIIPEDVKRLAVPALAHRVALRPEAWVRRVESAHVIDDILKHTPTPRTAPS